MSYVIPNDATHVALVVMQFEEGEPDEWPVMFGSKVECDSAARLLPAVNYTGPRKARSAEVGVYILHPFCRDCGQRHEDACPTAAIAALKDRP